MQFNTKLNIGDKIWRVSSIGPAIKQSIITDIHIVFSPASKETPNLTMLYGTDDHSTIYEHKEDETWWRTREALVKHLLRDEAKSCHSECQCTGGNENLIEELLNEMIKAEKDSRKNEPTKEELADAFDKFFEPTYTSGRPKHVTEEEAYVKEMERQYKEKMKFTDAEKKKIDQEFDQLFGEYVCTRPKAKTQNELNQLYDELFER